MILPDIADPPYYYRLMIAQAGRTWITDNNRYNWRTRSSLVKRWRAAARILAPLTLPLALPGAHIVVELRFTDRRQRDPNNWNPTVKACIDGMVDAGVFADDNAKLIEGPDLRLGPIVPVGDSARMIFHIWPKPARDG